MYVRERSRLELLGIVVVASCSLLTPVAIWVNPLMPYCNSVIAS